MTDPAGVGLGVHAAFAVPFREHAPLFREIEALGYPSLWTNEIERWDAFALLHAAGAGTNIPVLGTAIATALSRGPALLAMQASALSDATEGRFVLGIGPGSPTTIARWNGLSFDAPVRRMADTVVLLRDLFSGKRGSSTPLGVDGFRLATPPSNYVPVFMAASRRRMLEVAWQHADGVLLSWVSPEDVLSLRAAASSSGLTRQCERPFEVMASVLVCLTDDPASARSRLKRQMMPSLAVPTYRGAQRDLGRAALLEPAWNAWDSNDRALAAGLIPDSVVDLLAVVGTPEQAVSRLREYQRAGVDYIGVALAGTDGSGAAILEGLAALMSAWIASERAAGGSPLSDSGG